MLGIETEIMSSERMDENECKELEKNFQTNNIDKDAVVEFLKANTMRYPYDLRVYALDTRKKDTPYCRAYYSLYNKK